MGVLDNKWYNTHLLLQMFSMPKHLINNTYLVHVLVLQFIY